MYSSFTCFGLLCDVLETFIWKHLIHDLNLFFDSLALNHNIFESYKLMFISAATTMSVNRIKWDIPFLG